jgi:hypothetical protein
VTHQIELSIEDGDQQLDPEFHLDVFEPSPSFVQDEAAYEDLKRTMLGDDKIQSSPDHEETDSAYTSYYGQLGQRLCAIDCAYQGGFEACFEGHYSAAHSMTTDELRASARFYAHLLAADALPWCGALGRVRVTVSRSRTRRRRCTSSSRCCSRTSRTSSGYGRTSRR